MPKVIVYVVYVITMCIWYLGVWVGLTLWTIRIKKKPGESGRTYEMGQLMVILMLFLWPITAIPWFLWRLVKWASNKMEEVTPDA